MCKAHHAQTFVYGRCRGGRNRKKAGRGDGKQQEEEEPVVSLRDTNLKLDRVIVEESRMEQEGIWVNDLEGKMREMLQDGGRFIEKTGSTFNWFPGLLRFCTPSSRSSYDDHPR